MQNGSIVLSVKCEVKMYPSALQGTGHCAHQQALHLPTRALTELKNKIGNSQKRKYKSLSTLLPFQGVRVCACGAGGYYNSEFVLRRTNSLGSLLPPCGARD